MSTNALGFANVAITAEMKKSQDGSPRYKATEEVGSHSRPHREI